MKKNLVLFTVVSIILFTSYSEIKSCPKCNDDFKKELMDKRANTLGGKELIEAIKNQSGINEPVILPVSTVTELPQVENNKQEYVKDNTDDTSISLFTVIKLSFIIWLSNPVK